MQEKQNYSMCNPQYPFVFLHLWNVLTFVLSRHGYSSYPAFFPCCCQGIRESGLKLYGEAGAVRSFHQPQRLSNSMQVVAHVLIDWVNLNL